MHRWREKKEKRENPGFNSLFCQILPQDRDRCIRVPVYGHRRTFPVLAVTDATVACMGLWRMTQLFVVVVVLFGQQQRKQIKKPKKLKKKRSRKKQHDKQENKTLDPQKQQHMLVRNSHVLR